MNAYFSDFQPVFFSNVFIKDYKLLSKSGFTTFHSFFVCFLKFIYLFLAALGLRCCARAFSSCGEQGLLLIAVHGLLITEASLCCGAWALGVRASVVVVHRLSCSVACGIFPEQGSNPYHLHHLHWQVDS